MGLFSKRPQKDKDKEHFLGAKLTGVRYSSLQELVIGEVSFNSADSKIVTITFDAERIIKLWVADDKIIAATDSATPVTFREFLYWIKTTDSLKSILITDVKELNPEGLPSISTLAPALFDSFLTYSNDYTIETLKWATANFDSYTSVDTQLYKLKRVTDVFQGEGIANAGLSEFIAQRLKDEEVIESLSGIAGVEYTNIVLSLGSAAYEANLPEELFILAASEAGSNLRDTLDLGRGFSVLKLLETAKKLTEIKAIELSFTTDSTAQLPDLTDSPIKPYERVFVPTELGGPILELSQNVFAQSAWLESILDFIADNEILEERISVIEDKLINELADEAFVEFAELPGDVQASVRLLLNERVAHNDKRAAILNKILENILVQEWDLDSKLTKVIHAKLKGVADAVIRFELVDLTPVDNDFQIDEQELEFTFNDGVIETDANGAPFIREIAEGEEFEHSDDSDPEKFFTKAAELAEGEVEVDLDSHAFAFDEFYENLTAVEKAALGVRPLRADRDTLPPIFLQVASKLGITPKSIRE